MESVRLVCYVLYSHLCDRGSSCIGTWGGWKQQLRPAGRAARSTTASCLRGKDTIININLIWTSDQMADHFFNCFPSGTLHIFWHSVWGMTWYDLGKMWVVHYLMLWVLQEDLCQFENLSNNVYLKKNSWVFDRTSYIHGLIMQYVSTFNLPASWPVSFWSPGIIGGGAEVFRTMGLKLWNSLFE